MDASEIENDAEAEERANRRKRDALRGDKPVQFSMFDPVVAYDAISNNWINVAEVAKLGIQAAHKKLGVAREERMELQINMENLRQQLRGMQEHHVHTMDVLKVRLEILEKITKRKKKYRNGTVPTVEQLEGLPHKHRQRGSERDTVGGRTQTAGSKDASRSAGLRRLSKTGRPSDRRSAHRESLSHFLSNEEEGSSSDDSSVRGVTAEQQIMLDKIEPLSRQIDELKTGLRKEGQKCDALNKKIEKNAHQMTMFENRINDELSTRALSLLFRQVVFTDLPSTLENFVGDKFQVFRKVTDALERKIEAETGQRNKAAETLEKSLHALTSRVSLAEAEIQSLAEIVQSSTDDTEEEEQPEEEEEEEEDSHSHESHADELEAGDAELQDLYSRTMSPKVARAAAGILEPELQVPPSIGGIEPGEGEAPASPAADDGGAPRKVSLGLPIAKRQLPSNATSQDPSQGTQFSGGDEGGGLDEVGLPRTLDGSDSAYWGPAEDPEVEHPQRGAMSDESSQFFPRSKSRKGLQDSVTSPTSVVSAKSTRKSEAGSTTRRRSIARMEKSATRKEHQSEHEDESPDTAKTVSVQSTRRSSKLAQKAEDAINALLRAGKGKDGGDRSFSLDEFTNLPNMQDSLKAQKEVGDRLTEDVSGLTNRLTALEETVKELAASVQQLRELSDLRTAEAETRLANVEMRTDSEFQRVIGVAEDRVMGFLRESELERARLWHQMAVIFPRFVQDDEESTEKMTITEARMFALDVRLDTLEGGILRLLARDPDCMPKPRRRHTRRIQPDKEDDHRQRSPSPIFEKDYTGSGEEGECATRASASPASSPEPRPLQIVQLPPPRQARPSSRSRLRSLLLQQQDLIRQEPMEEGGQLPSPCSSRPASAVAGSAPLERIAAICEVPQSNGARHPPSRVASVDLGHRQSLEGAVLDVMDEARSVFEDTGPAEALRSLGHLNPGAGRWRAGDAASGRVLEQEQGINNLSAKQRKAFQPFTPKYKPVRPLDLLRDGK